MNSYRGCLHGCVYCYAPSVLHEEERPWGQFVDVKINAPSVLARELVRKERGTVFVSSAVDPYQPVEAKYQITRKCLEVLQRRDFPIEILTRSPLVLRDLDVISKFSEKSVGFSITSLHTPMPVEPRVPGLEYRLRALRTIANRGIPTWVSIAPIIPGETEKGIEQLIRRLAEVGVEEVSAGQLRLNAYPISLANSRGIIDCDRPNEYFDQVLELIRKSCEASGISFGHETPRSDRVHDKNSQTELSSYFEVSPIAV